MPHVDLAVSIPGGRPWLPLARRRAKQSKLVIPFQVKLPPSDIMSCACILRGAALVQPGQSMASPSLRVSTRSQLRPVMSSVAGRVILKKSTFRFGRRRSAAAVCAVSQLGSESVDSGSVIEVQDSETMEKYIQEAGSKLVVVDVSTTTCGPCKLIYPKFIRMSLDYPDALFLKINGDLSNDTRGLMRKWNVRAVPNFRFFRNGELLQSYVGGNEDELRAHFMTQYVQSTAV